MTSKTCWFTPNLLFHFSAIHTSPTCKIQENRFIFGFCSRHTFIKIFISFQALRVLQFPFHRYCRTMAAGNHLSSFKLACGVLVSPGNEINHKSKGYQCLKTIFPLLIFVFGPSCGNLNIPMR